MVATTQALLEIAEQRFSPLSMAERKMLEAAVSGTFADCGGSTPEENDPAGADAWEPDRTIRSSVIRWLCVDRAASIHVDPRGIQVAHARIDGELDLSYTDVHFPLRFLSCAVREPINLEFAHTRLLSFRGCRTGPFTADELEVNGDLILNSGFQAKGTVRLLWAEIKGDLVCRGGKFQHPETALNCDRVQVGGNVFLNAGLEAVGEVRLPGAIFGGGLGCQNSTLAWGLDIQQATIKGPLIWKDVQLDENTIVDFSHASVFQLDDASSNGIDNWERNWPQKGNLRLNGFSYETIAQEALQGNWVTARANWIGLQPRYMPQP